MTFSAIIRIIILSCFNLLKAPQHIRVVSVPLRPGIADRENNHPNAKSISDIEEVNYVHNSSLICCINYQNRY